MKRRNTSSDGSVLPQPELAVSPGPAGINPTVQDSAEPVAIDPDRLACPMPHATHQTVQIGHGSGGRMMARLIREELLAGYGNAILARMDDFALLEAGTSHIAVSTDSFVVDPIFFPGGDIGELAVYGTVNDVAMSGARPLYLTVGMILEEGFSLSDLRSIAASMRTAAERSGVRIVAGDTKVVHRGKGDKIFINTTGVGVLERTVTLGADRIQPDDLMLISGTVADHGMAILSQRDGLAFDSPIESDSAPLNGLIASMLDAGGSSVHALRDATRGGVAAVLNEFAESSRCSIHIQQDRIPIRDAVSGACEFLGLDPLCVANEGKLVAAVDRASAGDVLEAMQAHELGRDASIIGQVRTSPAGLVVMHTRIGGQRVVDLPTGEQLPRIC